MTSGFYPEYPDDPEEESDTRLRQTITSLPDAWRRDTAGRLIRPGHDPDTHQLVVDEYQRDRSEGMFE